MIRGSDLSSADLGKYVWTPAVVQGFGGEAIDVYVRCVIVHIDPLEIITNRGGGTYYVDPASCVFDPPIGAAVKV